MYLQKRYTIGKVFRRRKGIYSEDANSKIEPFVPAYKSSVTSLGLTLNGVALATFHLKNGLPYRGLRGIGAQYIAIRQIKANQILISVPRKLLISSRTAYQSELQTLFQKYSDFFLQDEEWEEHILMAFLISEQRKGKQSNWYEFINQLPNDIDLLLFWTDEKLILLQDTVLVRKVKKNRQEYNETRNKFYHIMRVTPTEFKWAYTNLYTRDFGHELKYKCMIPFCEYFNHECVDVHIALYPNQKDKLQFREKLYTEEELLSVKSSSESDYSEDLDQDISDFEDCIGDLFLDWSFPKSDDMTSHFLHSILQEQIATACKPRKRSSIKRKQVDWEEDEFEQFMMKCQNTEQFERGAQVYFNYGRLSNRELMLRYGIALEYNKHDHVYLRVDRTKYLSQQSEHVSKKQYISFKLKYTDFPIDLIRFCKAVREKDNPQSWDTDSIFYISNIEKEVSGLQLALELLGDFKKEFKENLGESEILLRNKKLGYDEYFALVYRLERQRIVKHNMMLMNIAIRLLQDCSELQCIQYSEFETSHEVKTNRILLQKYFDLMRI